MKTSLILPVILVSLLSGCAFQQQAVVLRPEVQPLQTNVGQGRPVLVNVVDERPRSTLGTRGAQGVGAELTVAGELTEVVRGSLAQGLQQQGFVLAASPGSEEGRELRVEIRNLDYRIIMGFWSGTLNTECGLKAICIRGASRPFEQLYRGEFQESIQIVQSDEANERYLNQAVSRAINSLLQDQRLIHCLAQ